MKPTFKLQCEFVKTYKVIVLGVLFVFSFIGTISEIYL